ncbi:MAG: hypothetical protein RIS41_593 [Actinomycetota bacterium]
MLLAAVGIGAVGVVQMSVDPRADAESISIGTISAQMSDQEGVTEGGAPDGTTASNCIRYEPADTSSSSEFVTSPGEALTSHGRTGESCPTELDGEQQTVLAVAPASGGTITNGEPFLLAEVALRNKAVEGSGAKYYDGMASLAFGDFDGDPTVALSWRMTETTDETKPCPFGGGPGGACRDAVVFSIPDDITMIKDDSAFRLSIVEVSPVEGEEACPATPAVEIMAEEEEGEPNTVLAREGATGRGCVYGVLSQGRLVTIAKSIEGVEDDVVAPSKTFVIESGSTDEMSPWNTEFELTPPDDGTDSTDALVLGSGETVTLTEQDPMNPRWELTDVSCTGSTDWEFDSESGELTLGSTPKVLAVDEDGPITCTFTNTYTPLTTLTLVKEVLDGEATVEDFTLTAMGIDGTPTEDVEVSGVSGSSDVTEVMVPAGEYILSEDGAEGYLAPEGWDCGDAELDGSTVTLEDDADVICTIVNEIEREEISLSKTPAPTWFSAAGQTITYTYTITNSGNQPLGPGQFKVADDRIDAGVAFNCGASTVELDPDETVACTRTYTSTAADVTAGEIVNEAFASLGELDSESVTATVDFAVLVMTKTASPTQVSGAGQTITYTYTLTNNGTSPLGPDQFKVTDDKINSGTAFNCGTATTTLAVAGTVSCTATYTVIAADITAGKIVNVASASGGGVTSPTVTVTVPVVTPPIVVPPVFTPVLPAAAPSLKLTKTASPDTFFAAGEVITYTYVILNDGTAAIGPTQFKITDNKINGGQPFNCGPATKIISVNLSQTCTATYTITAADVAAGLVTNTAFATGGTVDSNTATATVTKGALIFPAEIPVTGSMSSGVLGLSLLFLGLGLGTMILVRRRRLV